MKPVMPNINVKYINSHRTISCNEGSTLLSVLQENGFEVHAPCGGNGTCGKCKVYVSGKGSVISCKYLVKDSIDIVLPGSREASILTSQHAFSKKPELKPGNTAELSKNPHGVAIDIGTSTLAFYLVNLQTATIIATNAAINPQAKYGADIISRINYAASQQNGLNRLQQEILKSINRQLVNLIEIGNIERNDIVKITIAGNTTMLHILLGVDPLSIALVPFKPTFTDEQLITGSELNMLSHPKALVKILPSIAAFVGADIVAGIASINPTKEFRNFLFIDIGTNGEMALVTPEKIWCCATAAGPAFEGANISCGMSAVEGAINTYNGNGYSVIGNTEPAGICGSGLVDVVAYLVDNRLVQEDGLLSQDYLIASSGKENTDIIITQQDIRELQLAKSAIFSGVQCLLRKALFTPDDIDVLFLAGGFGSYIDVTNAIKIGMLPEEMLHKTISAGNTAATGAYLSLISTDFDQTIQDVRNRSSHFDLTEDENFMMDFVMNMSFTLPLT
jgi:uncharacterized 2Fe-2S/4Fe-4S cluster protein (DUF4445 family)